MARELGPIEIICDAPPYPVVRACAGLGFHSPQDVRWTRMDRRSLQRQASLLPWRRTGTPTCSCGQAVPPLESYTFTFVSGKETQYHLGQCPHCRTIFWDPD